MERRKGYITSEEVKLDRKIRAIIYDYEQNLGDRKGEHNGFAKLKESDIIGIRKLYDGGFILQNIADKYNTSVQNIRMIGQ